MYEKEKEMEYIFTNRSIVQYKAKRGKLSSKTTLTTEVMIFIKFRFSLIKNHQKEVDSKKTFFLKNCFTEKSL